MTENERWTFAEIDWPDLESLTAELLRDLCAVEERFWFRDPYRNCHMLPLLSPGGKHEREDILSSREQLALTAPAREIEVLNKVHALLKPVFEPMGRLFIIRTPPGGEMNVHIDSSPDSINRRTPDPKFRWVLSGSASGLFFLGRNYERVFPNSTDARVYMIDGNHPHGMINGSTADKYTFCLGAPWKAAGDSYEEWFRLSARGQPVIGWPEKIKDEWVHPRYKGAHDLHRGGSEQ